MIDKRYLRRHEKELRGTNAVITPICIVVDRSGSMGFHDTTNKTRMQRLNEGIQTFIEEIRNDDMLADSVEISIIGFTCQDEFDEPTQEILKFSTIDNIGHINIDHLNKGGDTALGVKKALDVLEEEKQFLKNNNTRYNQPWIVIFSDGRATPGKYLSSKADLKNRMNKVQSRTRELEKNKKLNVIAVLISDPENTTFESGYQQMKGFSAENRALVLWEDARHNTGELSFKDFFKILGRSVSVSNADLMFDNNHKKQNRNDNDNVRTKETNNRNIYSPDRQERVQRYLRMDDSKSARSAISDVKLVILLPDELDDNECLMVAYNPSGKKVYSDIGNAIKFNSTCATLDINMEKNVGELRVKVDLCEKETHMLISTLDESAYSINGNSLIIDLTHKQNIRKEKPNHAPQKKEAENVVDAKAFSENIAKEEKMNQIVETVTDSNDLANTNLNNITTNNAKVDVDNGKNDEHRHPLETKKDEKTSSDDDYLEELLYGIDDWDNI